MSVLKRLVEFTRLNYPNANLDEWLDSKYIYLNNAQLQKIASALASGELAYSSADKCPAEKIIFHFGDTLIRLKKNKNGYSAELAWETDFKAIHSTRKKMKGFYFINFAFDNHFKVRILSTDKKPLDNLYDKAGDKKLIEKAMLVVKGFIVAISVD